MPRLVLALVPLAFLISFPLTYLVRALSLRLRALDTPPVHGQVKFAPRKVPNTGGIAVFWAVALPVAAGLVLVRLGAPGGALADRFAIPASLAPHLDGIRQQTPLALLLLGSLAWLHTLGLIDDRRPLGPWLKLAVMAAPALAIPALTTSAPGFDHTAQTRLLTALDARAGGPWLSILITALWFLVVTNAMNFMDNMDGLSAGVGAVAASCFLAGTLLHGQWFVAACLALLVGALLGFLVFNFPRRGGATIFLGDGGSLVLGFLLAFLTVRTTYYASDPHAAPAARALSSSAWYAVFMPLIVLAVPLYDFASVTVIRLSKGRSPLVGDLNHLSHRLTRLGLSRRGAVLLIYLFTAATGLPAIFFGSLAPWQAGLVAGQVLLLLGALALFEWSRSGAGEHPA